MERRLCDSFCGGIIMNKKVLIATLQREVKDLEIYYDSISESDYVERGITLGKINAFLKAINYAYDLEEK